MESGHFVLKVKSKKENKMVSIPLESGHFVFEALNNSTTKQASFNPLGIGSFCIHAESVKAITKNVSIPLESGHFVLKQATTKQATTKVSIPLESGHFVFDALRVIIDDFGFNPLGIGSFCIWKYDKLPKF